MKVRLDGGINSAAPANAVTEFIFMNAVSWGRGLLSLIRTFVLLRLSLFAFSHFSAFGVRMRDLGALCFLNHSRKTESRVGISTNRARGIKDSREANTGAFTF